ncbi:3-hydroxyacyl-CoA dehydrogenase family protein [Rhodovastum atsumiense]|uniref:L-gulonate 3-dehydrogenase n=1 Tax=Rhodovastum atsumiense TaxID=504468 RepID=A0A5M6J3M1_9PROT|nr:3-hydroxyacyl-CoA dehydrogenase family protein [Rhodovastum atsumiense]KAA5614707.1 3-hydroxyacyl-CoA dehydrogenase family protein [Rhodovastum atsumiense]CAH2599759.1 3-hydroxyacyl-CoA dehydrogenase family protein [Rhodovastum atsumiense]
MQVAVIGAGHMGHALALVFALGGHAVRLTDTSAEVLARAGALMEAALATLREAGEVDAAWTAARLHAVVTRCPTLAEAVSGAELIVEAIVEKPEAKRELFAEIDLAARDDAIIASNTSYLDIFPLVPRRRLPRTLIAHWYTPPYLVDLCDIVGGDGTDPAVVATVRDLVAAMGKVPVVMRRFIPGYIANRIQSAIALEVNHLLDEGYATPSEIDDAIIHGLALRMPVLGHLAKTDFTGLVLARAALANGTYAPPPARGRSETLDLLVEQGRTGVMSGRGYFDWGGRTPAELLRDRDRRLLALRQALRAIGPLRGD